MSGADPAWFEFASAAPLAATAWLGLGPFHQPAQAQPSRLASIALSSTSRQAAIETAGAAGSRLLSLLTWYQGSVDHDTLTFEAHDADPADLADSVTRLVAAGLVARGTKGSLRLTSLAGEALAPMGVSLADPNVITSDALGLICQNLELRPMPTRKHERIAAIKTHFSQPKTRARVISELSDRARALLVNMAEDRGPRLTNPRHFGFGTYALQQAATPRYAFSPSQRLPDDVVPLAELAALGLVGLDPWGDGLWIWREAWPLLQRPIFQHWPSVPAPTTGLLSTPGLRLPPLVGLAERALQHWQQQPPPVLKTGDRRLAKTVLRATAKALKTDEATVEVIATTALAIGLLLPNVVKVSGRGRNQTVDQVWLADPETLAAWTQLSAAARWLRIVSEWINPQSPGSQQLVANRHLLLWELSALDPDKGWLDDAEVAAWIEHRYAPTAVDAVVLEGLRDLRALGLVTADGLLGLTELGRLALRDVTAVEGADFGSADRAIVQADETIICPPDLAADLMIRIARIATLESDTGARIFRLNEVLLTKAVQQSETVESIIDFLETLSSVPLPDTVRTVVADAAARAHRVRIVEAGCVLIAADPVDLATACKLKSARLTAVTDTVAVSPLAPDKLRQILDGKRLAPIVVALTDGGITPRRASDRAAELERDAQFHREMAARHNMTHLAHHATHLEAKAAAARNPASKFAVKGPLAVTPELLQQVKK